MLCRSYKRLLSATSLSLAAGLSMEGCADTPAAGELTDSGSYVQAFDGGTGLLDPGAAWNVDAGLWSTFDAGAAFGALPGTDAATNSATDGGRAGTDGGGTDAQVAPPTSDLCKLHGYEIAMVGDSYINLTSFASVLADVTHKAGALPANETYVDHSFSGASMDGFPAIPPQWGEALADAKGRGAKKIKLLIMTGGGNDVLVNNRSCLDFKTLADITPFCKDVVTKAMQRAQEMIDQAAKDGLEQAIYFFYPHLPKGGIGGGPYPNTILDFALPKVREFCLGQTKLKCNFVDLVPAFDDGTGFAKEGLINVDGIHPTGTGTQLLADIIWKVMQDKCLGSMKP